MIRLAAGLVALVFAIYWQVGEFELIALDDPVYVGDNLHVQGGLTARNIEWSISGFHDGNWIPLTWLSLMLDTTLFGTGPRVPRDECRAACRQCRAVVLISCAGERIPIPQRMYCGSFRAASAARRIGRLGGGGKDVLSTLFGLLSLLAYVGYCKSPSRRSFAASFLCFAASLLAKQTLVTLPFVFLLLDYWPLGRLTDRPSRSQVLLEKIPFLVVSAAFSIVAVIAQKALTQLPRCTRCLYSHAL